HEKTQWVNKMEDLLNTDGINEVIEAHQTIKAAGDPMTADTKEKLDALLSYYKNNRNRMNYGSYKTTGYLVGSGPIESANRNVIQKRLKLSGQRWTQQGAQNMASLRAFIKSMRLGDIQNLLKAS